MPLLGGLLASLFGWLAKTMVEWFGKRVANQVVILGTFGAVFSAVMLALKTALQALAAFLPGSDWLLMALSVGMPPAAPSMLSIYSGVWAACRLYRWQVKAIEYVARV
ncbi:MULTISPECIES: DUF5455 family protein [Cupriavidus]|uniref:DUF5455 family protein n=1 Tax=Cupriavidus TaxID=106589 RepID=UPI0002A36B8A|nr:MULTISPECIES: DUF5455 family protein [Cupriavidus]EKZ99949.1 hypothetical protein D769_07413 [Cupriavidus sp. HMR-1]QWC89299.1 DUF5455 family protein [Cupriavidus metallidurans]